MNKVSRGTVRVEKPEIMQSKNRNVDGYSRLLEGPE